MNEETYIKDRLDDQLSWYEKKGSLYKKVYLRIKISEIIFAAMIPFLTVFTKEYPFVNVIIGAIGVSITILAGLLVLNKYHDQWILYRKTAEDLKREKFSFLTKTGPYNGDNAFNNLVDRVEKILANESQTWNDVAAKEEKNK